MTTEYFSYVGSYDGAVKIRGRWVRVKELNRINKTGWDRWRGPPSAAIVAAIRCQPGVRADVIFPELAIRYTQEDTE